MTKNGINYSRKSFVHINDDFLYALNGFWFQKSLDIKHYFALTIVDIIDTFLTLCLWEGVFGFRNLFTLSVS